MSKADRDHIGFYGRDSEGRRQRIGSTEVTQAYKAMPSNPPLTVKGISNAVGLGIATFTWYGTTEEPVGIFTRETTGRQPIRVRVALLVDGGLGMWTSPDDPKTFTGQQVKTALSGRTIAAIVNGTFILNDGTIEDGVIERLMDQPQARDYSIRSGGLTHSVVVKPKNRFWSWDSTPLSAVRCAASIVSNAVLMQNGELHMEVAGEVNPAALLTDVVDIASVMDNEVYYIAAVRNDGSLWIWGRPYVGAPQGIEKAYQVLPPAHFKQVRAGFNHLLLVDASNDPYWVRPDGGEFKVEKIEQLEKVVDLQPSVNGHFTVGLGGDGVLRVWSGPYGDKLAVQIGDPLPPVPTMVDPIQTSPQANEPSIILTDKSALVTDGRPVVGTAADGVAKIVIRIPTYQVGEAITVTICREEKVDSSCGTQSSEEYGAVATLASDALMDPSLRGQTATDKSAVVKEPRQAGSNSPPPMGFVIYRSPLSFTRKASGSTAAATTKPQSSTCPAGYDQGDCTSVSRSVFLRLAYESGITQWHEIKIVRPPVVLVHGYTSDPSSWDGFTPIVGDRSLYRVIRLDYSHQLKIADSTPRYSLTHRVRERVVGVYWNEARLITALRFALEEAKANDQGGFFATAGATLDDNAPFSSIGPIALVQADVIGHSMGGLILKAIWEDSQYLVDGNYRQGYFHKMITLGTPYLGSHSALRLMDNENNCVQTGTAVFTNMLDNGGPGNSATVAFSSVTLVGDGNSSRVAIGGAAGDMVGDGRNDGFLSLTLKALEAFPSERRPALPTALMAGIALREQYANIDVVQTPAYRWAHFICEPLGNFLATLYSGAGWPTIFGRESSQNDGFVSVNSALDGRRPDSPGAKVISGTVHGLGTVKDFGMKGPSLQQQDAAIKYAQILLSVSPTDRNLFRVAGGK